MFIVEDGTGMVDANAYVDTSWSDAYFMARGNSSWAAAPTAAKETALVQATDYLDVVYDFPGRKLTSAQALEWPRSGATTKDGMSLEGIPTIIKKVASELAVRALSGTLMQDLDKVGFIKRERIEGAVEIEYGGDGVYPAQVFTYIDKLLASIGIIKKSGSYGQMRIMRV